MKKIQINKAYQPLYSSDKRYFILTGGRGSGKSFAVEDLVMRFLEQPKQHILFTRYTMRAVSTSIIPLFVKHLTEFSDISRYNVTRDKITNTQTGAFVQFMGIKGSSGDQTGRLKSLPDITTWIIDEGEDFNDERAFVDIDDSIRAKGIQNRVIWIQNPTTREHFIYKRFFEHSHRIEAIPEAGTWTDSDGKVRQFTFQRSTHKRVCHIHTTYLINRAHLNKDVLNSWDEIKINNPKRWAHKYGGAWLDKSEGVIFDSWKEGKFDNSLPYIYGMDFGFTTDPTTLIKIAVDKKRKIVFWDEQYYSSKSAGTDLLAEITKARIEKRRDIIIADSAEPRLISDLRKRGLNIKPCTKGRDSVRAGLLSMQDYTHVITAKSHNVKKEFNNYVWNDRKAGIPIDDYNHAIDAGRYAFDRLTNRRGIVTVRKG